MSPKLITVMAILFAAAAWYWLDARLPAPQADIFVQAKMAAPDVTLQRFEGDAIALSSLQGRYVLLNFWASWCAPCKEEFPDLVSLSQSHSDTLTVLALSSDRDAQAIAGFLHDMQIRPSKTLIIAHDPGGAITREQFHTYRYPESVLIDPQGMIVKKVAGILSEQDIQAIVSMLRR